MSGFPEISSSVVTRPGWTVICGSIYLGLTTFDISKTSGGEKAESSWTKQNRMR